MKSFYSNNARNLTIGAWLWLIIVISLIVFATFLIPKSKLNTSVLSLLPETSNAIIPDEIMTGFQNRLDKQLVWLIKPGHPEDIAAIKWWYDTLKQQTFIQNVNGSLDQQFQQNWAKTAFQYRYQLIDQQTLNRINNNTQLPWILSQFYSPFSGLTINELTHDPLLILRSTQFNQLTNNRNLTINNNWLTASDEHNQTWYMIYAELKGSSFNIDEAQHIVSQLNQLTDTLKQQWPNTEIVKRGVLFYSHYASSQAKNDISIIGSLSIIGIVILILIVFRSFRPILLTILSITIGILTGLVAVLTLFGEIHIITLVMSTSIIGITIDYALHYLTDRMLYGDQETPLKSLSKLFNTLFIALATSLLAYLILLLTPFPGLRQLATFAIFGLTGAFFTVICWYPFLVNKLPVRTNIIECYLTGWLKLWQKSSTQIFMTSATILFITIGLIQLKVNDDIGQLQTLPTDLYNQEQKIVAITKQTHDQKWFIVYGQTAEQTLQRLERFIPILKQAKQNGLLSSYQTINLSSLQKQQQNIDTIKQHIPTIIDGLKQAGIVPENTHYELTDSAPITPQQWLASPISQGYNLLWLNLNNGQSATLIPISGIQDIAELQKLSNAIEGVQWLDRRQEFTDMFINYRVHLSKLLVFAIIIICSTFIYRNRNNGITFALKSTLPTLLSIGASLAILGFTNQPLNLFSLLALILVIGIGIDYSLFLSNTKSQTTGALLAVSMAALTTLLSFGLLVLSHTNAIVGFSLVLTGGIFTAFLFAPIVQPQHQLK